MDFETIFNIIIVLIVIWSVISRMRKKPSSESSDNSEKTSGWKQIIQDIVTELSDDEKKTTTNKDWEYLISERDLVPILENDKKAPPPIPATDDIKKERAPETKAFPQKKRPRKSDHIKKELQKAVVWSEILGRPVGLRE